jgi:hypothetical protein
VGIHQTVRCRRQPQEIKSQVLTMVFFQETSDDEVNRVTRLIAAMHFDATLGAVPVCAAA